MRSKNRRTFPSPTASDWRFLGVLKMLEQSGLKNSPNRPILASFQNGGPTLKQNLGVERKLNKTEQSGWKEREILDKSKRGNSGGDFQSGSSHCLNPRYKEAREKFFKLDLVTIPSTRNHLLRNVREASFTYSEQHRKKKGVKSPISLL